MRALTDAEQEARGRALPARTQAIFGFDMDTWDDWCTRVRPEDCIMAHRPPVELPGALPAAAPTATPAGAHTVTP